MKDLALTIVQDDVPYRPPEFDSFLKFACLVRVPPRYSRDKELSNYRASSGDHGDCIQFSSTSSSVPIA